MDINHWLCGIDRAGQVQDPSSLTHTNANREKDTLNATTGAQSVNDPLITPLRRHVAHKTASHKSAQIHPSRSSSLLSDRPTKTKEHDQLRSYTRQKRRKTRPDRYEPKSAGHRDQPLRRTREKMAQPKRQVSQPQSNKHDSSTRLTASPS